MAEQPESKISLVSKSDIRYEGFLHFINAEENTVGLKNVRMLGTEGRKGGGSAEIAPNDQMYDFIIFRGSDIKDLTVYEAPQATHRDPAIVSATPAQGGRGGASSIVPPAPRGNSYAERAGARPLQPAPASLTVQAGADRRDDRRFPAPNNYQSQQSNYHNNNNSHGGYSGRGGYADRGGYSDRGGYGRGRGGYGGRGYGGGGGYNNNNGGGYGGARAQPQRLHTGQDFTAASGDAKESFNEQFDFDKAKEAFEKRRAEFEKDKDAGRISAPSKTYDKKSFFDNISVETKESKRQDREESKRADAETFGTEMVSSLRPFRRGRGGRGRYHSRF